MPPAVGVATGRAWEPVVSDADAVHAITVATEVGRRLHAPGIIDATVTSARRSDEPRLLSWRPEGLWQGYAGLALLTAALDAAQPDEGWDLVGREHLRRAVRGAESRTDLAVGVGAGLSGLAIAAWAMSREGRRYRNLSSKLETALVDVVARRAGAVGVARPHGVDVSTFDVIAGLTGAGRYLLTRRDSTSLRPALEAVLGALVYLSEEDAAGVPHWYTSAAHLTGIFLQSSYPHGHVNLGLAHGIPGPLALLSLAVIDGVEVEGQREAITRAGNSIVRSRLDDAWGINFPIVAAIEPPGEAGTQDRKLRPSRAAWCYGAPGIARALWLAGTATGRADYRTLAVAAMEAVYRRPVGERNIDSPTVCHGVAGLLQVTLRFANESRLLMFVDAARDLTAQLTSAYQPASRFGFRNLEPGGGRADHPGLLDGAAGVALVLLAAACPADPTWDRTLLLS